MLQMGESDIREDLQLDEQLAAQTLSVNGGPVAFSCNKKQSDAARNRKDRAVINHSSVTNAVPQQTSNNACDQSQKPNHGVRRERRDSNPRPPA